MKKLITILFAALSISSYAQNSFPTSNAIWNYKVNASDMFSDQSGERSIYYTICGDTVINGNICNKLYTTLDTVICGYNLKQLLGYFRQDEQKIYFAPYGYTENSFGREFLLYDFGLSIGDTVFIEYGFRYYLWSQNSYPRDYYLFMDYYPMDIGLIVSDIEIDNGIKKIILNGYEAEGDIWYEGIGSPYGLFNAGKVQALDGYFFDFSLNCFKHNDTVKYLNNLECTKCFCKAFIGIKKEKIDTETIKIFPNPIDDILSIRAFSNELINSIEIMDLNGKTINQHIVNAKEFELNISDLTSGYYLINIITNQSTHIKKIIKR